MADDKLETSFNTRRKGDEGMKQKRTPEQWRKFLFLAWSCLLGSWLQMSRLNWCALFSLAQTKP